MIRQRTAVFARLGFGLLACAVVATLLGSTGIAVAQTQGGEVLPGLGIRLLEVSQELADNPRANVYITDQVDPGMTIERRIGVSNGTAEPMPVELYGVAATVDDGWVVQDGRGGNELAEWITVEPDSLVLQPGEEAEVVATIAVPSDAGGGERYAAVVAEAAETGEGAVTVVSRVGVRVYLQVTGEEAPVADFEIDTLAAGRDTDGTPFVIVGVINTGDRAVDVTGELLLEDDTGALTAGPFPVVLPRTIGPGDDAELQVPMDPDLPAGPWLATADLQSGLLERQAQATITFPEEGTVNEPVRVAKPPLDAEASGLAPGLVAGGILGGLALIGFPLLLWWRRRRRADTDKSPEPSAPEVAAPGPAEPEVTEPEVVAPGVAAPGPAEPEAAPLAAVPPAEPPGPPAPPPTAPPASSGSPRRDGVALPPVPAGRRREAPVAPPAPPGPE